MRLDTTKLNKTKLQARDLARNWTAILIIQLVLTLPFYTANAYALTISDVRVTKVTSSSAVIEWNTDNISDGKVRYGKTTALGFTQRHDNFIGNHTVALYNGIDSEATYFFAVESTDLSGAAAIDNNSNNFYTFRTLDITPPPKVKGLNASSTHNSVFLSWDSLNIADLKYYKIYRDRAFIGNSTSNSFNDTGLSSGIGFSYKVSSVDNSTNEGPQSDTLIASTLAIDSSVPVLANIDVLPITDATALVTWLTNENSTTVVLYGANATDKIKSSDELVANHSIVIDGLAKGARYLFIAKSCDIAGNCANSSAGGAELSFVAGMDTALPFINLSIPRFVNRRVIDLIGSTKPFSSVTLFINNMNIPKRSLSSNEVGSSGKFVFSQLQLEKDNVIKIAITGKSGNKNQKTFDVSVDTEDPVIQLNDVPSLTAKTNLTISGAVNEPVTIKAFVDTNANVSSVPSKVTGLNATKIGQNFVELQWNESKDKDFSHYVVYREDASPIAIASPANFNMFIDALVDSGKSYTYQVSAVNIFAKEGTKSEPIKAATLKGGAILNIKPPEVDIFEDFRKPFSIVNASGSFNFGIRLDKGDTTYNIKLIFEDRAGNSVIIEKSVSLDTKKPEVKIISPPSGAFIFENVANEIDVVGTTKPNARVHLFIERTPFYSFDGSVEISGLPNEAQSLPQARLETAIRELPNRLENTSLPDDKLDEKCRFSVAAKSFCRTGADRSVDADANGNFKFEKVDLTAMFGGAARLREVSATEFRDTQLNPEVRQEAKKATLVVIATDKTAQRGAASQTVSIGTCWSGNQSWDIIPLTRYQSPALLSTERLAEGTETVYFYFNYSYIGRGTSSLITSVSISRACSAREVSDPRFNISCQVMAAGNTPQLLNPPENTISYSAMPLTRFPGMDKFLEDDWKGFMRAINNELTFPLKVMINYKHDIDNDGVLESETQTTCEQVSYVIDNSIIDPRKVLPDWLLYDFVDFLQNSIKTLTDVQEQINKVVDYVAVGCLASFGLSTVLGVYRRWVTFWEERPYLALQKATDILKVGELFEKNPLKPANKDDTQKCQDIMEAIAKAKGSFKMKYMTDADLRKCFPASASAWAAEANAYQFFRWSCDRIFGHAAPSRWTETESDDNLQRKVESVQGCEADQGVEGQPLTAENCVEFARKNPKYKRAADKGTDEKCVLVQTGENTEAVYSIGEQIDASERLYKITYVSGIELKGEWNYAIRSKGSDSTYITARGRSCEELCNGGRTGGSKAKSFGIAGKQVTETAYGKDSGIRAYCDTVEKCRSLNTDDEDKYKLEGKKITLAQHRGYTNDCFYNKRESATISDNPSTREECCCITFEGGKAPTKFYQPTDNAPYPTTNPVHESKTAPDKQAEGYSDMKWSYRYWKEKFEAKSSDVNKQGEVHSEYNRYRYIEGRDFPACFGFNNLFYSAFGKEKEILIVDPAKQHEAALQCLHLTGVNNRLQFIKNLMQSLSTCLIQVRTTGRGDSGACKELFAQHLCGAIWQIIRFFVDRCTLSDISPDVNEQTATITEYLRAGMTGIYDSISDLQSTVSEEYGNAKLNELLGTGEESIGRKICLAAFGYDWEIDLRNLVDAAYSTPFATLVQAIVPSREFLTVEPKTLKPKYEYRASWVINPGCDFERYDVYLSCIGRKQRDQYPNQIRCGPLGSSNGASCDCIDIQDERTKSVFSGNNLRQNVLEDKKLPLTVLEDNVRYDHLKFVLKPDRRVAPNNKPNCFPTGFDEGIFYFPLIDKSPRDIFDCRVDPLSGSMVCGEGASFAGRKGIGEILSMKINDMDYTKRESLVFNAGDSLKVDVEVRNALKDKCLKMEFDNQVQITPVTTQGIHPYTFETRQLYLGTQQDIQEPNGIKVQPITLNNPRELSINVRFFDMDKDNLINFDSDKDKIEVDRKQFVIKDLSTERVETSFKIGYKDRKIHITKEGAEIAIVSAELQMDSSRNYLTTIIDGEEKVPFVSGTIKIFVPQQNLASQTQQQQQKTLIVGLYHIRENLDALQDTSSCSWSEPVIGENGIKMERRATITVQRTGINVNEEGPIIRYTGTTQFKKDDTQGITISPVLISHPTGIKGNVDLKCKGPDKTDIDAALGTPLQNNHYEFRIVSDKIDYAGKYTCTISATSTNNKPKSVPFDFEVMCGDAQNGYGRCGDEGKCKDGEKDISGGFGCSS